MQGANKNSWFLYPQTKGEAEENIKSLGFERTSYFRPGLLDRGELKRTLEAIGSYVLPSVSDHFTRLDYVVCECVTNLNVCICRSRLARSRRGWSRTTRAARRAWPSGATRTSRSSRSRSRMEHGTSLSSASVDGCRAFLWQSSMMGTIFRKLAFINMTHAMHLM